MLRFLRVLTLFLVSFLSFDVASWATTSSGFYCDASKTYVECDAGYYLSDCGSYRDGRTVSRPAAGNSCKACPSATSSAYYECSGGAVCPKNMVENEFSISINVPKTGTVFGFNMSASGVFYVNWGDGRAIQKIDRTGVTANTGYPHTYTSTGTKTITISGQATAYNDSSHSMPAINFYYGSDDTAKLSNTSMIRSVSGSLGSVFGTLSTGKNPRFNHLFTGAVNLTSVPSTLFSGITGFATGGMFTAAFMNTGLTSIPDGLFAGISGDIKPYTFSNTFNGCRGLTSIPENLFGNISGSMQSYAFYRMFKDCAALTGGSAKINGQYVYDIWRSATATQVGEMYANATGLADYPCIPTNYGGAGTGVCVDIVYDANGGTGNPPTSPIVCVYGQPCPAPENTYTYTGKSFMYWKRTIDGSNVIYPGPGQDILSGLTSSVVQGAGAITLSAQWGNPSMYTVMLNNTDMGGTGGTTEVYTTGGVVFYSDAAGTTAIKGIRVPTKQNATYMGHYTTSATSGGVQCIGQSGEFTFASGCEVTSDTRWYARYQCDTGWTDAGTVINEICGKNITVNLNNLYATKKGTEILYARGGSGQVFVDEGYTDMLRAITIPENVPVFTFDTNGGTVDLSGVTGNPAIAQVTGNSITLTPLVFNGYYSAASGGTQYIDATGALTEAGMVAIAKSTENLTWYAQWNTGANIMPMPTPVRAGYNFQMWNVTYDGNGQTQTISVSAGQRLGVPTSAVVTAYWIPKCNEITLNPTAGTAGAVTTLYKLTDSDSWYTDLKCTALVQDLSSVIPSRVGYLFRGFYPQSYGEEFQRDIIADYETDVPAVIAAGTIIPGWNTTSASTLYASWVKDCEVPNNGTCSVSIWPGGEIVDYTTTCNTGYAISGNNTATPVCTANSYTCSAGQYLNGATCATCMAGSYCTGGTYTYNGEIQGQAACPSGYSNSDAGSDSESDCYRSCTASDVLNATTVSGRVYSDGTNACDATGCVTGYSVKPGDLNTIIGTVDGENVNVNASTFSVDYGDLGSITGRAQCSSQSGTAAWKGDVTISSTLPDSTGRYCYCALDGYTPVGGSVQSLSGPWVFYTDDRVLTLADVCADGCAGLCADGLQYVGTTDLAFRTALFGSVPSTAQCVPNTYTVSFNANGGTGSAPTSPTSCTYDSDCTAPANTYTKTGYTFAGWTCTGGGESCNGDVIAAGGSLKNVSTGSAITLTAKWTVNSYTCSAGQYLNGATCATCMTGSYCTGGTYTYNGEIQGQSACPSGYGYSEAGSDSASDCYRACTTSDVVNATAVSGRVYSDGTNACDATGCKNGYSVQPGSGIDLNSTIGTVVGNNSTYDTSAMTFGVGYGDLGTITGHAQCSTQGGTGASNASSADQVTTSDSLPDSSGEYCWCSLDGYTPSGGVTQSLSGPWVFLHDRGESGNCAEFCAGDCAYLLQDVDADFLVFRAAVFGSLGAGGAQCVPNTYTVSYAANGGTGSAPTAPTSCTYDGTCTAPANTYTKTGYTFAGWTCTGGGESCNGDVIAAGGSLKNVSTGAAITLTAKWTANVYKVTLDKQGGTGGTAEYYYQYKTKGNCYYYTTSDLTVCTDSSNGGTIAVPTRTGYTFGGYYTGTNGSGTQYVTAAGVTTGSLYSNVAADTTLYAKWTANTYTVSFNANGGTGGQSANVTVTYDAAMPAISTTAPSRTGYTFVGWYDNADYASGTQYYSETGASARTWNKTANTTLYAGWTKNGYNCKAGEYLNVTACKVCESGYYCPSAAVSYTYNGQIQGRTACSNRPGNAVYTSATGNTSSSCPWTCNAGYYGSSANGDASCAVCGTGNYCTGGLNRTACSKTYANTTTTTTTATSASACVCEAGFGGTSAGSCTACAKGYYKASAGTVECTVAQQNYYVATTGAKAQTACTTLGSFYTKTASTGSDDASDCYGTTTAGKYVAEAKRAEITCAAGGYCPGSVNVNYGSYGGAGGRTACAAGKYNANTGSSEPSACVACAIGSYAVGTGNTACTACAAGTTTTATGHTSATCSACANNNDYDNSWATPSWTANQVTNLCKISNCKAGSKYSSATGTNTTGSCTVCEAGTYQATNGSTATSCSAVTSGCYGAAGATSACPRVCGENQYSDAGASSCTPCATPNGYGNTGTTAEEHAGRASCKTVCDAGMYVATAGAACENVGAGYYAPGGEVSYGSISKNRGQCPVPLTTIGYGYGANEADDCGRKLHAGDGVVYLRSAPRTSPALNVKVGDTVCYGAMSSTLAGKLKVKNNNTTYSVVNDYQ